MIGIEHIASYIPTGRINNIERASLFSTTEEQIRERIGFHCLAIKEEHESTLSMALHAVKRLIDTSGTPLEAIEALVVVTQNSDRAIPHASADLHGALGLPEECACFDIGLGCSGYVYALSILSSFMQANDLKNGIIVTADPYSVITDPNDKNTTLLFGDAATATLLSRNPCFTLGKFIFGTQGAHADKLAIQGDYLHMNGRAVFNFAASYVPDNIRNVVEKNNLTLDGIDLFLVHQGSKYIVDTITERLQISPHRIPFLATEYGNTVSSSIPLMLEKFLENESINTAVLCGFGLGFSWGSTVITRQEIFK